jgi:hypothetical protein
MAQSESGKQDSFETAARRNRAEAVGRAGDFAAAAFSRAGFRDPALVLRWRDIVGPEVANFAQPLRLAEGPTGGVLTLKAEPAAAVFLQHETRILCDRINAYLGRPAVARLRFVKGEIAADARPSAHLRPAAQPPSGDPALGFAGPDRLKAALVNLARARQRPEPRD